LWKRWVLSLEWKTEGVIDGESKGAWWLWWGDMRRKRCTSRRLNRMRLTEWRMHMIYVSIPDRLWVLSLTVRVENSASWLTVIVSLSVHSSGLEIFDATETKATSRNVCAVTGVEPAEDHVLITDIRPSLSHVAQVNSRSWHRKPVGYLILRLSAIRS